MDSHRVGQGGDSLTGDAGAIAAGFTMPADDSTAARTDSIAGDGLRSGDETHFVEEIGAVDADKEIDADQDLVDTPLELTLSVGDRVVLREPRRRLDRRAIGLWAVRIVVDGLWFAVPLGIVHLTIPPTRPWVVPLLILIIALTVFSTAVAPIWRYHVHRWEATDQAVFTRVGWLTKEWRIVPISRVQSVDVTAGPLEQILKLATLRVTTASKQAEIKIVGLDVTDANAAARDLSEITRLTREDAT